MGKTIENIKDFWEKNPIFYGESKSEIGTREFFEEYCKVIFSDSFAGRFEEEKFIPKDLSGKKVLDLGCGVGFWSVEIQRRRKCGSFYSADLTKNAVNITKNILKIYNLNANLSVQNAESMQYDNEFFDHVNCPGVIHYTPDPKAAIKEIARVLKNNGTAYISVYYKNFFLKHWKKLSFIGKLFYKMGGGLKGRGRESIFLEKEPDEITRLFDGKDNPIGKSYSKEEIFYMVSPYFSIEHFFLYYFPRRTLPFPISVFLQRFFAKHFGFLIYLQLRKKELT